MSLIDRLREQAQWHSDGHGPLHKEAADEIERLRAQNQAYRLALDTITKAAQACHELTDEQSDKAT